MKQQLLNSLKENDDEEELGLNEIANGIKDPEKAIKIIKHYHEISKTQNKRVINIFGKQGQLLKKELFSCFVKFFSCYENFFSL